MNITGKQDRDTIPAAMPQSSKKDIPASISELDRSIDRLSDALGSLAMQVEPLLTHEPESTNACSTAGTQGACELSATIWTLGARVDAQVRRIDDLRRRMELP